MRDAAAAKGPPGVAPRRKVGVPGCGFTCELTEAIVKVMCRSFLCWVPALVVLAGCAGHDQASHRANGPIPPPEPYVRISNSDSNRIQLQIAVRKFVPEKRDKPAVWLTGVSHIGDTNYYVALQKHLDAQTLVLFEGVGAAEAQTSSEPSGSSVADDKSKEEPTESPQNRGSLQSAMAASLGLVFQLEAIDYHRRSFRNSDLSITQLRQLMTRSETASGPSGASESFENLIQLMDGDSWFDALLQLALRLLGSNRKFQALGRLALIDLLGQIEGDPSRLGGLPPDMKELLTVLLQRRNEKVIADLKSQLFEVGAHGSIAIFFGTGHMPDLETRLRRELGYRPADETWFTAFEVNLASAQVSPTESEFIDNLVKWQLREAGASSSQPGQRGTPGAH
jgi:hypothetical protein